jgi:predicted deacylase
MHGNEINWIMMAHEVIKMLELRDFETVWYGSITVVPVLNPSAFTVMERQSPYDGKDLNRCFGKKSKNLSYSVSYAKFLYNSLYYNADHGIDIHDAGGRSMLVPHPRIQFCATDLCNDTIHQMARRFDSKIILERTGEPWMLAVYAQEKQKKPIITIEIWGNQHIYQEYYHQSLHGIANILQGLWYLWGKPQCCYQQQYIGDQRNSYKAKGPWVLKYLINLGDQVSRWQKLVQIYYPLTDRREDIISEQNGYVFSIHVADQIAEGGNILSVLE